jgi:uncharacterized membrane protein YfcA
LISLWLALAGACAGALGALLGVGGGILLVPLLTLAFEVPVPVAVTVSLVAVIATSSAASGVFIQERLCDVRLGVLLEVATVTGAIAGAAAAARVPPEMLRILLALVLLYVAGMLAVGREPAGDDPSHYRVRRLPLGVAVSLIAGSLSATLGVGGGPLKVPTLHLAMGVPIQVATATSNLMIGATAAGSVFLYYQRGHLDMAVAIPTVLGVYLGARLAAPRLERMRGPLLRRALALILLLTAGQMALSAYQLSGGSP